MLTQHAKVLRFTVLAWRRVVAVMDVDNARSRRIAGEAQGNRSKIRAWMVSDQESTEIFLLM